MRARCSWGTRLAASPTISSKRTSARLSWRSPSKSARFRPRVISTASRAWSSIWRRYTLGSRRDVLHLGFRQRLLAEVAAQELGGVQINLPAQGLAQLRLHAEKLQAWNMVWLEFDQNVEVTLGGKNVPQDRPGQIGRAACRERGEISG